MALGLGVAAVLVNLLAAVGHQLGRDAVVLHHLAPDLLDLGHALPRNLAPIPDVLLEAEEDLRLLHRVLALLVNHLHAGVFFDLVFARSYQASVCFEALRDHPLPPCELVLALRTGTLFKPGGAEIRISYIDSNNK